MSSIRKIPYAKQSISDADIDAVSDVLRGKSLTQGEQLEYFESDVSAYVGCSFAVAVNSATSALHLACIALGVQKDDVIWTSPISFVASANCGLYCGASVSFVDINIRTGLIDVVKLEEKLVYAKKEGRLPKVLIVVHLAGSPCDMRQIREITRRYGVKVIEDASHAIGGSYQGSKIGSCEYSDVCIFSFHPVKIITTGEGGMACTNDDSVDRKIRALRGHGIVRSGFVLESPGDWYYEQQDLGYNYRICELQCALGRSQLKRVDEFVAYRHDVMDIYRELIRDSDKLCLLEQVEETYSAYHLGVVSLRGIDRERHRKIFRGMRDCGIFVQLHYWPIHLQPYYRDLGFKPGDYPKAEEYARTCFSLPVYYGLPREDQEYVVRCLRELVNENT